MTDNQKTSSAIELIPIRKLAPSTAAPASEAGISGRSRSSDGQVARSFHAADLGPVVQTDRVRIGQRDPGAFDRCEGRCEIERRSGNRAYGCEPAGIVEQCAERRVSHTVGFQGRQHL